jgi:hypothetical protein
VTTTGRGAAQDDFRLRRTALSRGAAGAPDALYDEFIMLTGITADDAVLKTSPGSGKA